MPSNQAETRQTVLAHKSRPATAAVTQRTGRALQRPQITQNVAHRSRAVTAFAGRRQVPVIRQYEHKPKGPPPDLDEETLFKCTEWLKALPKKFSGIVDLMPPIQDLPPTAT